MENNKIAKIYLIISLIVGSILILIVPPFQSPDEDTHFMKSFAISEGNFIPESKNEIIGYKIPANMFNYIQEKLNWMSQLDTKYTYTDLYYDQLLSSDFENRILISISTNFTTPIAHIVPAIGIVFSKIFSQLSVGTPSTAYMLYFARMMSMIIYSVLGYFAIKRTPAFKKTMFVILLLPMTLFLRSMVSYDTLLVCMMMIFISEILSLIYENTKFKKYHYFLFIIIGYIFLNIKTIYFPIFLLMFLIPYKKFGSKKQKIKAAIIIIISIVVLTVITKIPSLLLKETNEIGDSQFNFVLEHPIYYIKILFLNIKNQFFTQIYWMIGTYGLLDTYIPPVFVYFIFIGLLLLAFLEGMYEKIKVNLKIKGIVLLNVLLTIALSYTAMYILWTPKITNIVGGEAITGVQGRYFIPILIYLPLLFSNKINIKNKKLDNFIKEVYNNYYLIPLIGIVIMIFSILLRYWV